ncbi:MAG: type II methionyl aminopeptidase [Candidatus Ranarchaeia archaeon]
MLLRPEEKNKYRRSGEIAKELKQKLLAVAKPGCPLLRLTKIAEIFREEYGERVTPAFPLNISINEIAAHYSPLIHEPGVLPRHGVVKLDLGVQIDGYISDTALTVDLDGKHKRLIDAARSALNAAIATIKDGVSVKSVSSIIEETIVEHGFRPIYNLTGHKIERYKLHGGINVPNTASKFSLTGRLNKFKTDDIYAIEPFATDGAGYVIDGHATYIYRLVDGSSEEPLLQAIKQEFDHLPFSPRWIPMVYKIKPRQLMNRIRQFVELQKLSGYPELIEKTKAIVSQFEHTIRVTKNGCEVLT